MHLSPLRCMKIFRFEAQVFKDLIKRDLAIWAIKVWMTFLKHGHAKPSSHLKEQATKN